MHGISVTFISEYNQSYHTYRLVIKVFILLCVSNMLLFLVITVQPYVRKKHQNTPRSAYFVSKAQTFQNATYVKI